MITKFFLVMLAFQTVCLNSFGQWTRVDRLPPSNIFTLFHNDTIFYAGGTNVIYVSNDNGETWDSTTALPGLSPTSSIINHIIVFKNELYASSPLKGVFKSLDGGSNWQNINSGIDSLISVSDFCEYKGDLYAATDGSLGNPFYKLNSASRTDWLSFNNGLTSISSNATSIVGNGNALIGGVAANGLYDYLPADSISWQERFLLDQISPNEKTYDIITAHDTFFLAGSTGRFYISTDNGLNWNLFGNRLVTAASTIVNAKQALVTSTHFFADASFITAFFYIKKDSLQNPFVNFSIVRDHFTYKTDITGNKLWDASDRGLFYMPLSALPGISAADDSVVAAPLPVRFISFNANCVSNRLVLTWKTAQEENNSHFDIERSVDGVHWIAIGNRKAAGNSNAEKTYSFTDIAPLEKNFYRIAEYDLDGKVQYSSSLASSCNKRDALNVWPNPAHEKIFINIVSANTSQATIKIFDGKGALINMQRAGLFKGSNQLSADLTSFANGIYLVSAEWNNGQMKKTVQVLKK